MRKPKSINELMNGGGARLAAIKVKSEARNVALERVRAALPPQLAAAVVSAGIDAGRLTLGVAGAQWAARLRYSADTLKRDVGAALGATIDSVRIKVVPPQA